MSKQSKEVVCTNGHPDLDGGWYGADLLCHCGAKWTYAQPSEPEQNTIGENKE